MVKHALRVAGLVLIAVLGHGCGPSLDLKTLKATDVFTGFYDAGVVNGQNKLVPSVSFRLQNTGNVPGTEVDLTVSFWVDGADGEWDSKEVAAIGSTALAPGASTQPILVRADAGYTSEAARADFFSNSVFKDVTAKVFVKRSGIIVPLGEFKVDRRVIPHVADTTGQS